MQIEKEHFLDASEQNADGSYDYYYEGDVYRVTIGDQVYTCRSYTDEPERISFITVNDTIAETIPYDSASFITCAKHFHNALGFRHIFVLVNQNGGSYAPIDFGKLPRA